MELNTQDIMKIFDVTFATVYNWRLDSVTAKKTPLPFHTEKFGSQRHRVFFRWSETKHWAKVNGVQIIVHPKNLR